jgi:hypothetical protein
MVAMRPSGELPRSVLGLAIAMALLSTKPTAQTGTASPLLSRWWQALSTSIRRPNRFATRLCCSRTGRSQPSAPDGRCTFRRVRRPIDCAGLTVVAGVLEQRRPLPPEKVDGRLPARTVSDIERRDRGRSAGRLEEPPGPRRRRPEVYAATTGSRVVPEAAMAAGVKAAHSRGKLVFAHPSTAAALLAAVRAGVDVVAHTTPQSGAWDAATIATMRRANSALVPTLKLWSTSSATSARRCRTDSSTPPWSSSGHGTPPGRRALRDGCRLHERRQHRRRVPSHVTGRHDDAADSRVVDDVVGAAIRLRRRSRPDRPGHARRKGTTRTRRRCTRPSSVATRPSSGS